MLQHPREEKVRRRPREGVVGEHDWLGQLSHQLGAGMVAQRVKCYKRVDLAAAALMPLGGDGGVDGAACPVCTYLCLNGQECVLCDGCSNWYHATCGGVDAQLYNRINFDIDVTKVKLQTELATRGQSVRGSKDEPRQRLETAWICTTCRTELEEANDGGVGEGAGGEAHDAQTGGSDPGAANGQLPPSPGEIETIAEEEENQMLATAHARSMDANSKLKNTELPGSRQSRRVGRDPHAAPTKAAAARGVAPSSGGGAGVTTPPSHLQSTGKCIVPNYGRCTAPPTGANAVPPPMTSPNAVASHN